MGLTVAIVLFLIELYIFWRLAAKFEINKYLVVTAWIIKLGFSILFVWFYSFSGFDGTTIQGDAYNFYYDGRVLADYAKEDFFGYLKLLVGLQGDETQLSITHLSDTNIWGYGDNGDWINDNRLMIRINSLIHFISLGNLYVHVLVFSGLSYLGIILIYNTFLRFVTNKNLFFVLLALFPSIAFWGSGLTKETLSIFSIGLFLYALINLIFDRRSMLMFVFLVVGILLLLFNKPYVGLLLIPLSTILIIGKVVDWKKFILPFFALGIIAFAMVLSYTPEKINLVTKFSNRQTDMINLGRGGVFFITDSSFCSFDYNYFDHFDTLANNKIRVVEETRGEYKLFGQNPFLPFTINESDKLYELYLVKEPSRTFIEITPINNSGTQLILNIPQSMKNTLVRPYPGEGDTLYSSIIFVVNLSLLGLIFLAFYLRKTFAKQEVYLVFFLFLTAFLLLLVIGWTTPVIGAIIRYKVPAELLILVAVSILFKPFKKVIS